MPTIQQSILDKFYQGLATADGFDEPTVQRLRALFDAEKKVAATDLMKALADPEDSPQ